MIGQLVKAIVVLRMCFVYPVLVAWLLSPPHALEVVVLILLVAESLAALLWWDRCHGWVERHPAVLGLDILLSIVVLSSGQQNSPFFLYLSATAVFIGLVYCGLSRILLTCVLLLSYIVVSLATLLRDPASSMQPVGSALPVLGSTALLGCLVCLGMTLRRMQDRVDRAVELASLSAREAALGQERSRIARELHDSTVKSLVGIKLLATAAARTPAEADRAAETISEAAEAAIGESRSILMELRDKPAPSLCAALEQLAERLEPMHSVGFDIRCTEIPLRVHVQYNVLKILEEAMANAAQHSGCARIAVTVEENPPGVLVATVEDHGAGFRTAHRNGHFGQRGMRERAAEIGGRLRVASAPGRGTTVRLSVPVTASEGAGPRD